eukprot:8552196-Heterocapsa_arctica.AAC.1
MSGRGVPVAPARPEADPHRLGPGARVFGLSGFKGHRQGLSPAPSDSQRHFDAESSNGTLNT